MSLREVFPNTLKRADSLKIKLAKGQFRDKITEEQLKGAELYANHDMWNAYYQWFDLQERGLSLGAVLRYQRKLQNSEYGLLVFPAARELGKKNLYGIDYRRGEKEFLDLNNKVLKKLLFRLKLKPLRTYMRTQREYKKAEKEGRLVRYINGQEFQAAFANLIDELPQYLPKSEEAKKVKSLWLKRNKIMAERLVKAARTTNSRKVLLTVGSAHVTHIKRFLEAQGHRVTTYGELVNR